VAKDLLEHYGNQDPENGVVTTLAQEKEINTFFRLQSPTIIARLQESFPELGNAPSPKEVFLRLRELRNHW
jgi:hydroxyacylglutathione hydrolase